MRNIQIKLDWGFAGGKLANIYQGGAGFQGGSVIHRANLGPGIEIDGKSETGWGWFSHGNLDGTDIHFECEFGGDNATAIEFAGKGATPPPFIFRDPDLAQPGGRIENSRSGNVFYFDNGGGLKSVNGSKGFDIRFDDDRWDFESDTLIQPGSYAAKEERNITNYSGRTHREVVYYSGSSDDNPPAGYYWWDEKGDLEQGRYILMGDTSTRVRPN
jgi:hypothetical protein